MRNERYAKEMKNLMNLPTGQILLTKTQVEARGIEGYISAIPSDHEGNEMKIAMECLEAKNVFVNTENTMRDKALVLALSKALTNHDIAQIVSMRDDIILIAPLSKTNKNGNYTPDEVKKFPFGIYQKNGRKKGIYIVTNDPNGGIAEIARRYQSTLNKKDVQEIMDFLRSMLAAKPECSNPYLVPVNNGVWDMSSKCLLSFSQDLVFASKIETNLNLTATNPVFDIAEDGTKWDVDSWLSSLGDKEFVLSIWEVLQAACLRLAPRNKMVLFFSTVGNNGKGTLCQLIRNLIGEDVTANIPLEDFSKRFGLSKLPNVSAIVTDENNVNSFSKGWANLKAVVTGDPVSIEQKYQDSYDYSFHGLVLQCINDYINGNDKTGSFQRRLHIIQFDQCFTGTERKYIKEELIYKQEVLEYVLKVVLVDMPYRDSFTETSRTIAALHDYLLNSNSVDSFLEEVLPQCVWNLLPATDLLYEAYKCWYRKTSPSGSTIGRNDFIDSVKDYIFRKIKCNPKFEWEWTDSCRWNNYIDFSLAEPLVSSYTIEPFWGVYQALHYHCMYGNGTPDYSKIHTKYSGLKRRNVAQSQGAVTTEEDN